jgi:RHS repeat-associated protein
LRGEVRGLRLDLMKKGKAMILEMDRKLQVSTFTYDALDRRVLSQYDDGSTTSFTYDTVGRLTVAEDSSSGRIELSYDNLDRLVQEITSQGRVEYQYDAIGRRTTMTVNGQTPVTYQYDSNSRLTQVAQGTQVVGLGYDAAGRRTSLTYPNGVNTTYTYDMASRLTNILHEGPSSIIEDLTYTYDAAGNRISFTRTNGTATLLPNAVQAAYDAANEQIQFDSTTPNLTYDANGNLTSQTDTSGTTTYIWDARNRLVGISGPGISASFVYDALGRRIIKTINGVTTDFQYDGSDIVAEVEENSIDVTYLRSLNIDEAFVRKSGIDEFYHTDALGSILSLTDQAGAIQTTYRYDPFGTTMATGTSSNPYTYTGRETDNGTGLLYYRARYYSPRMERFVTEDPIGFRGGDVNLYAYVWDNPIRFVDSYGLSKFDKFYGLSKKFWRWYERKMKRKGDPDLTKEEARELYKEWEKLGKPGPDKKGIFRNERGSIDPELLISLLPIPPLLDDLFDPSEIYTDPCEMPGGPPCQIIQDKPPCMDIGGRKDNCKSKPPASRI